MSNLARQYQQHPQKVQDQQQKQLKAPKQRKFSVTKGEKGLVLLAVVAFSVAVTFIIANYASVYSVNRDIHNLQRDIQQQTQVNDGLQLQVIELSAPDRILHIATEQLGMSLDDNKVRVIQN
ncbi:cell division protein FtsL [Alkalihalobacterium alkalinitrilicum]|uniref:cell division protein FtsL n=1 Tax=Alkalihalobacterium alkalinitrilicum TaxID=427920 RepID=UPI000995B82C|nr:cell division protein FtsL [Alkalihalobacterium alkalinitrilicum]